MFYFADFFFPLFLPWQLITTICSSAIIITIYWVFSQTTAFCSICLRHSRKISTNSRNLRNCIYRNAYCFHQRVPLIPKYFAEPDATSVTHAEALNCPMLWLGGPPLTQLSGKPTLSPDFPSVLVQGVCPWPCVTGSLVPALNISWTLQTSWRRHWNGHHALSHQQGGHEKRSEASFRAHQPRRGQMEIGTKSWRESLVEKLWASQGTDLRCLRLTWCWDITLKGGNESEWPGCLCLCWDIDPVGKGNRVPVWHRCCQEQWIISQLWQGAASDKLPCGSKDRLTTVQRDSALGQQAAMNFMPEILHVNTIKAVISHHWRTVGW